MSEEDRDWTDRVEDAVVWLFQALLILVPAGLFFGLCYLASVVHR